MKPKVLKGHFEREIWQHDPDAYDAEEIEFLNSAFEEAAKHNPAFKKMIWKRQRNGRPQIVN
jgi:hypothetical protein